MRRFTKRVIGCDCGYEVSADSDEELVAGVRRHALDAHGMALTAYDALLVAFRVELDDLPSSASETKVHTREEENGATT